MNQYRTPEPQTLSRAEQRKQRLLEIESEQAAEEAAALRMTEDQRKELAQSFSSVKVEFCDLDGQRWTQAALRMFQPRQRHLHPATYHHMHSNTYVVLTKSDLSTLSPDATIRTTSTAAGAASKSRMPLSSSSNSFILRSRSPSRSPPPQPRVNTTLIAGLPARPPALLSSTSQSIVTHDSSTDPTPPPGLPGLFSLPPEFHIELDPITPSSATLSLGGKCEGTEASGGCLDDDVDDDDDCDDRKTPMPSPTIARSLPFRAPVL